MKRFEIYLLSLLVLILPMCTNKKTNFIDNLSQCTYYDSSVLQDDLFYPFITDSIDYNTALKSICAGVRLDTFRFINHDNETDYILRIYDSNSEINFYRSQRHKLKSSYSLFEYSISSDLIKYNSNIHIGMDQREFFNKFGIKTSKCDSFMVHDRSNFYHFFIFEKNRLTKIERKMPIM